MSRIYAALIFFTRLPLWKFVNPPQSAYDDVVVLWPFVGWLTGGLVSLLLLALSFVLPWPVAVVLALTGRLMVTGALHEDGLADFCDGFGCSGGRKRILSIMKDSHIGTYGVIGLIMYFILLVSVLVSLPVIVAVFVFPATDSFSKFCAAQITNCLPYARSEGAKNGILYPHMGIGRVLVCFLGGAVPLLISCFFVGTKLLWACIPPVMVVLWLVRLMREKIGGYTGDCCGASFILCETASLVGVSAIWSCL